MRFVYRPVRGSFAEAMQASKKFDSLFELFKYVYCHSRDVSGLLTPPFDLSDIYLHYEGYDSRLSSHTFSVCVSRYGKDDYMSLYGCPQNHGTVHFEV